MRRLRRALARALALALALMALAALLVAAPGFDGPWGPVPGGALRRGPEADVPAHWPGTLGDTIEIETRPARPWSVTTWAVSLDDRLYASADFLTPWKRWPFYALEDPRVVVRSAGVRYAASATLVRDAETIARLRQAFARKYELAPDGIAARTQVWFFWIGPRAAAMRRSRAPRHGRAGARSGAPRARRARFPAPRSGGSRRRGAPRAGRRRRRPAPRSACPGAG